MANDLTVTLSDRFSTTGGEAASEVVAYDGFRYFVTNGAADRVDVFRAGVGQVGALDLGDLPGYAGVTSVAAKNGLVAVAIDGGDVAGVPQRGHVALFDAATLSLVNYVTVGFGPDSLIFSADGSEIYVANEGEPNPNGDAPGSVSIVTFPEGFGRLAEVIDVGFSAFDGQEEALRAQGVRIFPGIAASRDLEPEYLAIDPADGAILVTLQEANTVARIDRVTLGVTLLPQGTVNHAELGNGIDGSDRDGAIRIANWPVQGLRMADALAAFEVGGATYYATANEGDSRDDDEARVGDLALDPLAFPLAGALQEDGNLGRLQVSNIDGDFDQLFSFGARSFTIYDAAGDVVFDSGDDFEQIIAGIAPERFNTDEPGNPDEIENRSDNKGPEPEAIAVGEVDGRTIAVIGLERDSGLMVYDVTDPADATFLTYIDGVAAGDIAPEVIAFIPGALSPSGFAQVAVAYEVSGTTVAYDLTFTGEPVGEGEPGGGGTPGFDLRITEIWPGNDPGDNLSADWIEITNYGTAPWVNGADPILYYDDESADPAAADPINGIDSIQPGESVIVLVDDASAVATFIDVWSASVDLDEVRIGWADGAGLGQGGDAAALFVGGPSAATLADFQAFPDAEADGGQSWNVIAGAFSAAGDGFGSVATDVVNDEGQPAVGSPGFAIETEISVTFTLELLHIADQEASTQAVFDAPRASAVFNALEAQDLGGDGLPDNTLRLSSGDAILPGLFFQASTVVFGQAGVADMIIQNELGLQAIAFGNHEFDLGSGFIADLIDGTLDIDGDAATPETQLDYDVAGVPAYAGTDFPYLSANLDFSTEASLAPLEIAGGQAPQGRVVTSSTVLETGGELIGVVGATTPTLDFISSPGDLLVLPEVFDGAPTPEQLDALAALIQAEVDALLAANPTMNKVILLAHMQQIAIEQALAERLTDVDIIVAGGSNTRLVDETDRLRDGDTAQGEYPVVVENAGGTDTLVVNTDGSYKYVGRLVIDFDADGNILADSYDPEVSGAYATDAQGVADLGAEGLIDPEIQAVADAIGAEIALSESNIFGVSDVYLAGERPEVRQQETNLGNLTADANLAAAKLADPTVTVSIKNGGGIRNEIGQVIVPAGGTEAVRLPNEEILDADGNVIKPAGGISENDIVNALSFNNELTLVTLTTEQLRAVLEHGVAASEYDAAGGTNQQGRFPQVAGVAFSFDPDLAPGARVVNAAVTDENGDAILEIVREGATVDNGAATVRVVTLNFLAGGGDGYPFPQDAAADRVDLVTDGVRTGAATFADDFAEQDALAEYLAANFLTTPFAEADTPFAEDARIQNLNFRADAVFEDDGSGPALLLNEVLGSTTGSDSEYIELFGEAGASLDGLSVIVIESDPGASLGAIDFRFDFAPGAALGDNGFFLLANALAQTTYGVTADATIADNAIENSAYTIALVETASLAGATVTGAESVLDTVGVDDGDGAFFFGAPVLGPDGTFLPAGVGRVEDGVDTDTAADWLFLDFNNASPPNTPTPGGSDGSGGGGDPEFALISEVQGEGDVSPLAGMAVTVEAVVVGDFQDGDADAGRNLRGFYLQEEDADADGTDATSEGLFVFEGGDTTLDVALGDTVRVTGTVSEFFGETQLDTITAIEIIASGTSLPTAATIGLPAAATTLSQDGDVQPDLEAYEGMRVTFSDPLTIAEQFQLDRFNEIKLVAGERPQQFTQTNAPDVAGLAAHLQEVGARTITYDDGLNAQNAPISNLDGFGPVYNTSTAPRMGDMIENLSGVLSYQWAGNAASGATWRVRSTENGENTVTPANPRPALPDVGGALKVASFNVLNFFTTIDGAGLTGPNVDQQPRGADSVVEFDRQLEKLVTAITGIGADLLGVIEIENDPAGDVSLAAVVDALNFELGPDAYAFVDAGAVGGDAIKVGFVYKPGSLTPTGDFAVLDGTVDPRFDSDNQRPTLAHTFASVANGEAFTATISHFKSKGSSAGNPGDEDAGDGQGLSNGTRTQAAEALVDWLATDPTDSGDADFLILGDLNAYAKEDPIAAILEGADDVAGTEDDFVDLVAAFEGDDAFSFVFDGQTGTLDYALASQSLAAQVTGAAEWRINADEADALDYNLDFGRDPAIFDGAVPFRGSDHDPVLVGLDLDGGADETLTILAGGEGDDTRSPSFEVFADGVALGVRSISDPQTAAELRADGVLWESFVFDLDAAPMESVEIVYFNDRGAPNDVNLFIDAIEIGDRRFEAEIDGFFEKLSPAGAKAANGPREALWWNGTLTFDDLMVVA